MLIHPINGMHLLSNDWYNVKIIYHFYHWMLIIYCQLSSLCIKKDADVFQTSHIDRMVNEGRGYILKMFLRFLFNSIEVFLYPCSLSNSLKYLHIHCPYSAWNNIFLGPMKSFFSRNKIFKYLNLFITISSVCMYSYNCM